VIAWEVHQLGDEGLGQRDHGPLATWPFDVPPPTTIRVVAPRNAAMSGRKVQVARKTCPKKKSILPCIRAIAASVSGRRILRSGVCLRRAATHACIHKELRHRWAGTVVALGVVQFVAVT
jgi:hypothetical protein